MWAVSKVDKRPKEPVVEELDRRELIYYGDSACVRLAEEATWLKGDPAYRSLTVTYEP